MPELKVKIHQYRVDVEDHGTTYCGQIAWNFQKQFDKKDLGVIRYEYCLRCLYSVQTKKGEAYMLENGYPLVRRVARPSPIGTYYGKSFRLTLASAQDS